MPKKSENTPYVVDDSDDYVEEIPTKRISKPTKFFEEVFPQSKTKSKTQSKKEAKPEVEVQKKPENDVVQPEPPIQVKAKAKAQGQPPRIEHIPDIQQRIRNANVALNPAVVDDENFRNIEDERFPRATAIRTKNNIYMKRQIFEPNTWLMDLVYFNYGKVFKGWFGFFVEANTRYLIPIPANVRRVSADAYQDILGRADQYVWEDILKDFKKSNVTKERIGNLKESTRNHYGYLKKIHKLIGDSEKAFWTRNCMAWYKSEDIKTERVNTHQEGHIRLAILDRVVRTIRDMIENYLHPGALKRKNKLQNFTHSIDGIIRICHEYNNTPHSQLKDGFVKGKTKKNRVYWTPFEVHNDPLKEQIVLKKRIGQNWTVQHRQGYTLPNNSLVSVRSIPNPLAKVRWRTFPLAHMVKNNTKLWQYNVQNPSNNMISKVARRDLKPLSEPKNSKK